MLNLSKSYIKSIKDYRTDIRYIDSNASNYDSRYEKTKLIYDVKSNKTYHSIKFRQIYYETSKDKYFKVTSREKDRLDIVAQDYYKDASKWWIIAYANDLTNCFYLPIGVVLRIPYLPNLVF